MYVVYNSKFIKEVESSGVLLNLVLLELAADSVDDFPAPDEEAGQLISMGSIGYEITTGKIYVLSSEGTWTDSSGTSAADNSKSLTLSSPSTKGEKIEIEQPEEKELEILEKGAENNDESLRDIESR